LIRLAICDAKGHAVEEWLTSVGLGARIAVFREQGISTDQLDDLTDDDLRELGLTIGERKRFRRALDGRQPEHQPQVLATTRAERRPLTMMFVDLVNSSALGERLEPEDLLEVIRRYREFCGTAIMRYGGLIARLVGDGILAYFCYPVANENDPERAVRAALDIVRGIGAVASPAGAPFQVRIGIATGRVIVSDLLAGGEADRRSIIGSTPNLAARLQSLAPPGGVIIADETFARLNGMFRCEDLGTQEVRGFAQHHRAWHVLGEIADAATAGTARRPTRLTPFFDRQAESAVLAERWARAQAGEGNAVLLIGGGGIGKSRLVENFLGERPSIRAERLAASPFDEDSPLRPVIVLLRQLAKIDSSEPASAQREKLAAFLSGTGADTAEQLPLVQELLGIEPEQPRPALAPAVLRERLLSILHDQLRRIAATKPLCLVVEDLHWLDPTTRELLDRLIGDIVESRLLLVLTARDGFDAPWTRGRDTMVLQLKSLSPGDVDVMVQSLFGGRVVPAPLARLIARKTDGVPLFIEEVGRSMLLAGAETAPDSALFDISEQSIPASLHEALMARLDRSGVAKDVAQIAAVIGRSMRRDVLTSVAAMPAEALNQPLATLVDTGVLYPDTVDGSEGYSFTHALLRDAAYDSLLRDDRQLLHLRVARALQRLEPMAASQQPELLALHLTEAGQAEEAAALWLEAARRSLARSALTEATRMLRRGLAGLDRLPANRAVLDLRVALMALLGPALIALRGPGAAETQDLYAAAYALCNDMAEDRSHFPIYWGWWRLSRDFREKRQRAAALLDRAKAREDAELLLQAHHCAWATDYAAGDFKRCCDHIEAGLAIYAQGDYRDHARVYGNHDACVCAHGELAQVQWMQGRPASALESERRAMAWADTLDHLGSKLHAMDMRLLHRVYRREHKAVFQHAGDLVSFTSELDLQDHRAKGLIFRGWSVAMQDDPVAGLRILEDGFARQQDIGTTEDFSLYLCLHAEAMGAAGQAARAVEMLRRERLAFAERGFGFWMPELIRTLADMTLAADQHATDEAATLLAEAEALAVAQDVPMLGLRIAVTAAQLDGRRGEGRAAAQRLRVALARIAEDDGGPDLIVARALTQGVMVT
jgi:class 3 adenylate cyclase/predicted ATPase